MLVHIVPVCAGTFGSPVVVVVFHNPGLTSGTSPACETPPSHVLTDAIGAVAAAAGDFLYTRVDGIVSERFGGFCVTELEVVEPELFLRMDARAPERFAAAIARRLARE